MLSHPIPNNLRGADPTIPKEVLESKLKVIVQRRAEIEALLSRGAGDSYEEQELKAERQALSHWLSPKACRGGTTLGGSPFRQNPRSFM